MTDIFDLGLSHHPPKPPMYRRFLQLPAVALSLLVFVGIAFGSVELAGKYLKPTASNDYVGDGAGAVQVEVAPGDTSSDIAKALVAADVVKSTTAFVDAAQNDPRSRDIQPGTYQLKLHMSAISALGLLEDPTSLVGGRVDHPRGHEAGQAEAAGQFEEPDQGGRPRRRAREPKGAGSARLRGRQAGGLLVPRHLQHHQLDDGRPVAHPDGQPLQAGGELDRP